MLFIPSGQPPHKLGRSVTPASQRLAMLELAITSNPAFSISRVELDRSGPSYLVDTLKLLHAQLPDGAELHFVIGWDSLEELHTWYNPQGILEQLTHIVAVGRPGFTNQDEDRARLEARLPGISQRLLVISAPQYAISSTDLRQRVAAGRPIKYQVPEAVERYIFEHHLYSTHFEEQRVK